MYFERVCEVILVPLSMYLSVLICLSVSIYLRVYPDVFLVSIQFISSVNNDVFERLDAFECLNVFECLLLCVRLCNLVSVKIHLRVCLDVFLVGMTI